MWEMFAKIIYNIYQLVVQVRPEAVRWCERVATLSIQVHYFVRFYEQLIVTSRKRGPERKLPLQAENKIYYLT